MGWINDIKNEEETYNSDLFDKEKLDKIIEYFDSIEVPTDRGFLLTYGCLEQGTITINLKNWKTCNNHKCEGCSNLDNVLKKLIDD